MQTKMFKCVSPFAVFTFFLMSAGSVNGQLHETPTPNSMAVVKEASFDVVVRYETDSSIRIIVSNPLHKKVQLSIDHQEMGTVVDTLISSEDYSCVFNLGKAEDGLYKITLSSGKEVFRKEFMMSTVVKVDRKLQLQ